MTDRYGKFLVSLSGKSPKNLNDSIRFVLNASAGFRNSWNSGEFPDANETSQEAFKHLDYIQNELLRQRDAQKCNTLIWETSTFKTALCAPVGKILRNVTYEDFVWFSALPKGSGAMPGGSELTDLTLEKALNKLKHRDTLALNFFLSTSGRHKLFTHTKAWQKEPSTLSEIDIADFCAACKVAVLQL